MKDVDNCFDSTGVPKHILARDDLTVKEKIEAAVKYNKDRAAQIVMDGKTVQRQIKYVLSAKNPEEAFVNMLRPDRANKAGIDMGTQTLESTQDAIRNEAHSMMLQMMSDLRPGISDLWTSNNSKNFIKALYKEGSSDSKASQYAKAWDKVYDHLEGLYRARGGHMRLDRFSRVPVSHNVSNITKTGFDDWAAFMEGRIDEGMINQNHRMAILEDMYKELEDSVVSIPGVRYQKSKYRSDHDEIVFKDSQSWTEYNEKFGDTNLYDALQDQVTSMSHLTGAMEMFGSRPQKGYDMMHRAIGRSADPSKKAKTESSLSRAKKIFDTSMGHLRSTNTLARGMGSVRNLETGLKLGGAVIPAMTDVVAMYTTASFVGMPAFRAITRHITTIAGSPQKNALASRLLFGLEHMMDVSHSTSRYATLYGSKQTAKFAGGILKWSGLQGWTIGAKQSFGIEMNAYLTGAVMKPSSKTTRILKLYGMDARDVKTLQTAERFTDKGVKFIDPMKLNSNLRRKWVGMMLSEQKMAVPEADAGVQALLTQGTRQGTFVGEAMRSTMQFKMFPTTIIANHWRRALYQTQGAERYHQVASLVLGTTMLGVLAVQAKQILNGEEPQHFTGDPANDAALLFKGFVQGGSGAYVADLFESYANSSRSAGNLLQEQLMGPMVGDVSNLFEIVFTDIKRSASGDPRFPGLDATGAKLLQREMPNLWQIKLLLRRGITDQLNMATDPKWASKQAKRQQKMRAEQDRESWWKPGETSPDL